MDWNIMSINCKIKMRFMLMYDKNHFNIFKKLEII